MERQRKWQLALILTVIIITIYNVLPTVFYYLQPLKSPISVDKAETIALSLEKRTSLLDIEAQKWLASFCKHIHTAPRSIQLMSAKEANTPISGLIAISFNKKEEAERFRQIFPRAGALIPFAPSQMALAPDQDEASNIVLVCRRLPLSLDHSWFSYKQKNDSSVLSSRVEEIVTAASQFEEHKLLLHSLEKGSVPYFLVENVADKINAIADAIDEKSPLASKYAATLIPQAIKGEAERAKAVQTLIASMDASRDALRQERLRLKEEKGDTTHTIALLENKEQSILNAKLYLKKHTSRFCAEKEPLESNPIIESGALLNLSHITPFFSSLEIDYSKDRIKLTYSQEVLRQLAQIGEDRRFAHLLLDEAAKIGRLAKEELVKEQDGFSIRLHQNPDASGYLALDPKQTLDAYGNWTKNYLLALWQPRHPDLQNLAWIQNPEAKLNVKEENQSLCLLIGSSSTSELLKQGKPQALYVVLKGVGKIAKTYQAFPDNEWAIALQSDLRSLASILYQQGFVAYSGALFPGHAIEEGDWLFENTEILKGALEASREEFVMRGAHMPAYLELGTVEQRLLAENRIDNQVHADLLKWQDDYAASQVSMDLSRRFDVPPPTKSPFWSNLLLSAKKYIRGDERKIIRWGLDLSGGKTVQIELEDIAGKTVTEEADLKQAVNELYDRVNKMGVSEVSIRQMGRRIVLDFPGSQAMSAAELIQASTMTFHVVNEQYSLQNSSLASSVNRFLQEVWNEAQLTNQTDTQSLQAIASERLHPKQNQLRSDAARILWEHGLRLETDPSSPASQEAVSKIARFRGNHPSNWQYQSHPLLIVFQEHALEGAHLKNIHSGYDPSKGNYLSFEVADSIAKDLLFAWTSKYSKESVANTGLANWTQGRGWRMAAILNDTVINAPTLDSPLRDSAMISGSFSQREASQLSADLKAGSLSFAPRILSEKNVSPELGASDRLQGIFATFVALLLVIGSMIAYYRFAGLIASIAVIFNLLILWAVLQNLGAALTLAGLAGIILTVGMAVDANVLVFERVKEEFAKTENIRSALSAGYQKAYSAIIDSNITTIIAALILMNFDAGPIKSFAVNLIIGIASSMFTALFMTRFYFTGWVRNPKHTMLKMADWIRSTQFPFLKWSKTAWAISLAIFCIGTACLFSKRASVFGMDFTGGYALDLELESATLLDVEKALLQAGANPTDFQVRELDAPTHLRVLLGTSMEMNGKPFYLMSQDVQFENNPRIAWVVHALQQAGIPLSSQAASHLQASWTAMSGQISDSMRNQAIIGLLISFFCIFIYLAFRFEYKFAAAALLGLLHDVAITLGSIGLLYLLGVNIQIDLNTIAALMLVIGYSLNDTIIVFDRIREEMTFFKKRSIVEIVNHSLNATLGRTAITSGTTLLVLIALTLLGGASIFHFALVMTLGVFLGTLSSWFIVCPLMIFFHKREERDNWQMVTNTEL